MPRQKRVEFSGAIYHVVARGNRGAKIVEDDADRERFLETLTELIDQMSWELYGWALLEDQYHLVFRTPEADLVKGMTWFQNTLTKRYNGRHKTTGHLFAGRYQSTVVEEGEYLSEMIHYVHLLPEKKVSKQLVKHNPWSSLCDYQEPPSRRRDLIDVTGSLSSIGLPDSKSGRDRFWGRAKEILGGAKQTVDAALKSGWVLGSDEFYAEVSQKVELSPEDIKNGYGGAQLRGLGEIRAKEIIREKLEDYGVSLEDLKTLPKGDWRKAAIAIGIREETNLSSAWIGKELSMGTSSSISRAIAQYKAQEHDEVGQNSEDHGYEKLAVNLL